MPKPESSYCINPIPYPANVRMSITPPVGRGLNRKISNGWVLFGLVYHVTNPSNVQGSVDSHGSKPIRYLIVDVKLVGDALVMSIASPPDEMAPVPRVADGV